MLQETHCTQKEEAQWTMEWGGKILFGNGSSNSKGTAILVNKSSDIKILRHESLDGRLQIAEVKIMEDIITIVNVYGPNQDKPTFFKEIAKKLENYTENKIVMGDFNVALDNNLDRYNSVRNSATTPQKVKSRRSIIDLMDEYKLCDE